MPIALLTNYLADYRLPLYSLLAERHGVEVVCTGGGDRYVPPWFANLDAQLAAAPFPARRVRGAAGAFALARGYDAVIAGLGPLLPAAYAGARAARVPFVLWASVWAEPRSLAHDLARPVIHRIYRRADAVVCYGEHVRRFVAGIRGSSEGVFVARQSVEEFFAAPCTPLLEGPVVLYVGRLVPEKGVNLLLEAATGLDAALVLVGDGALAARAAATPGTQLLGPLGRAELPAAYASASAVVLASIPTPRFREPWGLVCNEAMMQGRVVVASDAVGAVAGGLVRDGETGVVVPAGDVQALRRALERVLGDAGLRARVGAAARASVADYTPEHQADDFGRALEGLNLR